MGTLTNTPFTKFETATLNSAVFPVFTTVPLKVILPFCPKPLVQNLEQAMLGIRTVAPRLLHEENVLPLGSVSDTPTAFRTTPTSFDPVAEEQTFTDPVNG